MKYFGVWLVVMWICHFAMCSFAAFVAWDASYFWLGSWNEPSRFVYIIVLLLVSAGVALWANKLIGEWLEIEEDTD